MKRIIIISLSSVLIFGCGSDPSSDAYKELIDQGWASYEAREYDVAAVYFMDALTSDTTRSGARNGLGWTYMRQDDLDMAQSQFALGANLDDASADLHAGYAFVANAIKSYSVSNNQVETTLSQDGSWTFVHDATLSASDLRVLKAQNYFALADFQNSLNAVKELNPLFSADVATSLGQQQLSDEIERLKTIN